MNTGLLINILLFSYNFVMVCYNFTNGNELGALFHAGAAGVAFGVGTIMVLNETE